MKNLIFSIKKNKNYSKWTEQEDYILMDNLKSLKIRNKWKTITKILNKKVYDCINRFKILNPIFKKGHWTSEEDNQVSILIETHGKNWAKISSEMKNRTGKQIRQRFLNFLDPKIKKEKFSIDEDMKIFKLFKHFKTNWRYYVKYIPFRTADMIKGRYYSSIRFKENFLKIVESLSDNEKNNNLNNYNFNNIENIKNDKNIIDLFIESNLNPLKSNKLKYLDTQINTSMSYDENTLDYHHTDNLDEKSVHSKFQYIKNEKNLSTETISEDDENYNFDFNLEDEFIDENFKSYENFIGNDLIFNQFSL